MRLKVMAENLIERLVLKLNQVPEPLLETQMAFNMARSIMVGVKLGVFEAAADGARSADTIANRCGTNPKATVKLLDTLTSCGYFRFRRGAYALTGKSSKWLLRRSPFNLCDKLLFQFHEWDMVGGYERYLVTGASQNPHASIADVSYWQHYQRGMRNLAGLWASDVTARFPMPAGARTLLDIGGSHGYYSVSLCRRYPALQSIVLDLPDAVREAAAILASENMGSRVIHQAGDVLTDELGEGSFDAVFISQLVHHFTEDQNRGLMQKIARALRPHGVCVILDTVGAEQPGAGGQTGALLDLYFAMLSEAGTWPTSSIQAWFEAADLVCLAPVRFRNMPGGAMVAARKPGPSGAARAWWRASSPTPPWR